MASQCEHSEKADWDPPHQSSCETVDGGMLDPFASGSSHCDLMMTVSYCVAVWSCASISTAGLLTVPGDELLLSGDRYWRRPIWIVECRRTTPWLVFRPCREMTVCHMALFGQLDARYRKEIMGEHSRRNDHPSRNVYMQHNR